MHKNKELSFLDLSIKFDFLPMFNDTSEIECFKDVIGQSRAIEAIEFGLTMDKRGYNIFASGSRGTGKRSYILEKLKNHAKTLEAPKDWCYVYNFEDSYKPKALSLKSGTAHEFKKDIEDLIDYVCRETTKHFSDYTYERERNELIQTYKKRINKLITILQEDAMINGFKVKSTSDGFAFVPLKGKEEMSEDEYDNLQEKDKDKINADVAELKLVALEVIKKTKEIKREMRSSLKRLDDKVAEAIIGDNIKSLKKTYGYSKDILNYLEEFKNDLIENIDAFIDIEEEKEGEEFDEYFYKRYEVNAFICNKNSKGVPVIFEEQPDYGSLIGTIEYENKQVSLITDFTMIKPGSMHKANGGYLVLEAEDLLKNYGGWTAIKRSLKTEKIAMKSLQNIKNQYDIISITNLEPEEIPLDMKIILMGNPEVYYILYDNDEDFREFFKVKAQFDEEIENNSDNTEKIVGFIANYLRENKLPPITRDGVIEILKFSSREVDDKAHYTSRMDRIVDLIEEASINVEGKIDKDNIKKAIEKTNKRYGLYKDKIIGRYLKGKYIFDIDGFKIGEINGLSVVDIGDVKFGRQNKITVNTYSLKEGIVSIEKDINMSGKIHNKGVLVLSGYFKETFGKYNPISFGASICFEQMYGALDGDSASLAELVCLISSLGEIEINQGIAVTGSINQKGLVQAVGGVNEKIEGFFDVCKSIGLTGNQGVIIPWSNVEDLLLKDEVIDAVKEGKFHIYSVNTIEDCFKIICKDELKNSENTYDIIKDNVKEKLDKYKKLLENKKTVIEEIKK